MAETVSKPESAPEPGESAPESPQGNSVHAVPAAWAAANAGRLVKGWKRIFLRGLRTDGNASAAARKSGVSLQHAYRVRARDAKFARAWMDARETARKARVTEAEDALFTRGVHGWIETKTKDGQPVETKNRFSDPNLHKFLEANSKRYARKQQPGTTMTVAFSIERRRALLSRPDLMTLSCTLSEKESMLDRKPGDEALALECLTLNRQITEGLATTMAAMAQEIDA